MRSAGLETLDRLLEELAAGGLLTLGSEKGRLLARAGELVRALKLRRLGSLVLALQRAATGERAPSLDSRGFANLLLDLYLTRRAVGAHLEGRLSLDPRVAEDLLGKTWREEELEPVAGLELIELSYTRDSDGEFRIETSYLLDLPTGSLFAERQIMPLRLASGPKPRHRHRVLVERGGLYPGLEPRRIRLGKVRHAPLAAADVDGVLNRIPDSFADLHRRLLERLRAPFAPPELPVAVRPSALVAREHEVGCIDGEGLFLRLEWPAGWSEGLPALLPEPGAYALFGLLKLDEHGLRLRPLSVLSGALRWAEGPVYPQADPKAALGSTSR
jgi:hypothetical protein